MRAKTFCISVLAAFVTLFAAFAAAAPEPVQHDETTYALDARYHEMPQALVDALKREVPHPPGGFRLNYWCFTPRSSPDNATSFCACYNEEGCRQLKASNLCVARLGAISRKVGVCRANEEVEKVPVTAG